MQIQINKFAHSPQLEGAQNPAVNSPDSWHAWSDNQSLTIYRIDWELSFPLKLHLAHTLAHGWSLSLLQNNSNLQIPSTETDWKYIGSRDLYLKGRVTLLDMWRIISIFPMEKYKESCARISIPAHMGCGYWQMQVNLVALLNVTERALMHF